MFKKDFLVLGLLVIAGFCAARNDSVKIDNLQKMQRRAGVFVDPLFPCGDIFPAPEKVKPSKDVATPRADRIIVLPDGDFGDGEPEAVKDRDEA